jgi:sn-glycerol 3-phosphate transport system permease protein
MNALGMLGRLRRTIERCALWVLAIAWIAPLLYALWAAVHDAQHSATFDLTAPWTLSNFLRVWNSAPFADYYLNTVLLVTLVLVAQLLIAVFASYAFAAFAFKGRDLLFSLVLIQLMVVPEALITENFRTITALHQTDSVTGMALPYALSAFAIFLLRQTFKTIPKELDEAAEMEGCGKVQRLFKVYVPLARPTIIAFALTSISYHWNNFLWPLIVSESERSRTLTVGLSVFNATETGVNWPDLSAAAVIVIAPLVVAFLIFQRQFVESFMRTGIR